MHSYLMSLSNNILRLGFIAKSVGNENNFPLMWEEAGSEKLE